MTGASGRLRVLPLVAACRPSVAPEGSMVLDVAGDEIVTGNVVKFPLPNGEWARGYVVACDDERGLVFARTYTGFRHTVASANCELQHGPTGRVLVCIERAGNLTGFAEVEAA